MYEFAGRDEALHRLEDTLYTSVLADPQLQALSYCNTGDPVCGNGRNFAAHLQYVSNGSAAAGAQFAATKVTVADTPPTSPPPAPAVDIDGRGPDG